MLLWIYKIRNIQNNKCYIGQTIRPVEQRFHRHLNDALNNVLDTHLARAIRKYGKENFTIETIDSAQSQEELNKKEQYWIQYYNAVKCGYNETDAISKNGGNTYQSKTLEELKIIGEKIRQSKIGKNNPQAKKIKRINIKTGEITIYDTVIECARACGIKNGKTSISTRLNGQIKTPFKKIWLFEYYNE